MDTKSNEALSVGVKLKDDDRSMTLDEFSLEHIGTTDSQETAEAGCAACS